MKFYFIAPRDMKFEDALYFGYFSIARTITEAWIRFDPKLMDQKNRAFDSLRLQQWVEKGYSPKEVEVLEIDYEI